MKVRVEGRMDKNDIKREIVKHENKLLQDHSQAILQFGNVTSKLVHFINIECLLGMQNDLSYRSSHFLILANPTLARILYICNLYY